MGKAQYLLQRDVGKEEADIQKKAKKRGLWANIGMGLGGLIAIGLTAGTATPLVAGLMSAGGTYAGGKLGDIAARQTGARIKGQGKFLSGQREGVVSSIQESITAGALKAGLTAGMTQWGAGLEFGKEGLTATMPGAGVQATKEGVTKTAGLKVGDIFKPKGGFTKDTFWGRVGESLDPKMGESFIGKGVGELGSKFSQASQLSKARNLQLGKGLAPGEEFIGTGKLPMGKGGVPDLESLFQEELGMPAIEGVSTQDVYRAKSAEISAGLKDYQFAPDRSAIMWGETDPLAVPGSRDMSLRDITTAKRNLMAARPEGRIQYPGTSGSGTDYTSNFPVGESADVVIDQGLIGPSEYTPFDRSSMIKRQATSRFQGGQGVPTGISGSGTDFTGTSAWEGVGKSFPGEGLESLRAPDTTYGSGTFGLPSTTRGYDYKTVSAGKAGEMSGMQLWYDRLFGDKYGK